MSQTSTKVRKSIIKDAIKASDFNNLNIIFCCEQCTYYEVDGKRCNFGYRAEEHLRETNMHNFNLSGRMAFCRFQEID